MYNDFKSIYELCAFVSKSYLGIKKYFIDKK